MKMMYAGKHGKRAIAVLGLSSEIIIMKIRKIFVAEFGGYCINR